MYLFLKQSPVIKKVVEDLEKTCQLGEPNTSVGAAVPGAMSEKYIFGLSNIMISVHYDPEGICAKKTVVSAVFCFGGKSSISFFVKIQKNEWMIIKNGNLPPELLTYLNNNFFTNSAAEEELKKIEQKTALDLMQNLAQFINLPAEEKTPVLTGVQCEKSYK
jgi:hypothetical protein